MMVGLSGVRGRPRCYCSQGVLAAATTRRIRRGPSATSALIVVVVVIIVVAVVVGSGAGADGEVCRPPVGEMVVVVIAGHGQGWRRHGLVVVGEAVRRSDSRGWFA